MKLEEAEVLAQRVIDSISHLCDPNKIQVAGSIRRKRPEPKDIDIVLIPQSWMWSAIAQRLKENMPACIEVGGPELVRLHVFDALIGESVQVDLYRARPETWGTLLLIRTGSVEHNIMMCSRAQTMGLMLSAKKGVIRSGEVIAGATEESIFAALKMKFVEPEDREV